MLNQYEKFFRKITKKKIKDLKDLKDIEEHTERVVQFCKKLCEEIPDINDEIVIKAAWIHDVGKLQEGDEHHNCPARFRKIIPDDLRDDDVFEIIKQHRGKFNPEKNPKECTILRLCDKIDKFRDIKKYGKKYEDVLDKCREVIEKAEKEHYFEHSLDIIILRKLFTEEKRKAEKRIENGHK